MNLCQSLINSFCYHIFLYIHSEILYVNTFEYPDLAQLELCNVAKHAFKSIIKINKYYFNKRTLRNFSYALLSMDLFLDGFITMK